MEGDSTGELIGQFPGWARALAALARSEREASRAARALADRLTHDPFLGETVHRMLTRVAAVRSAAEILAEFTDIPPARRERFRRIIFEESRGLSDVGEALAAYFAKIDATDRTLTPLDEVEALFDAHANRFDEIETAAAPLQELLERSGSTLSAAADQTRGTRRARARALATWWTTSSSSSRRSRPRQHGRGRAKHCCLTPPLPSRRQWSPSVHGQPRSALM